MKSPALVAILVALALGSWGVSAQEPVVDVARYSLVPPPGVPPGQEELSRFGEQLEIADLDRDGDMSVIVGETAWGPVLFDSIGYVALYESAFAEDGSSEVRAGLILPPPEFEGIDVRLGQSLAVGDFDSDGFFDLASYVTREPGGPRSSGGALILFGPIADDGSYARKQILGSPNESYFVGLEGIAAADFDGDGVSDLAAGGSSIDFPGFVRIFFGEPGVGLGSPVTCWIPGAVNMRRGIAAFDPDGDGVSDLVIGAGTVPGSAYRLPCGTRTPDPNSARRIEPTPPGMQFFGDFITPSNFSRNGGPPNRLLFGAWGSYQRPGTVVMWQMNGHLTYVQEDRFGRVPELGAGFGRTPAFGRLDTGGFHGALFACGAPGKKVDGAWTGMVFWGLRVWSDSDGELIHRTGNYAGSGGPAGLGQPLGMATAIGDVNRDGLPDIVAADPDHNTVVVSLTGIR